MFFMIVLCCFLSLRVQPSDATLQLEVNPSAIELDFTRSLTVNCTFTYVSDISNLISIILSKSNDDSDNRSFYELISISTFGPDVVIADPSLNGTASGHIDNSGVSYLSLYWTYPTVKEAGLYRCTVNGLDSTGQPKDVSFTGQVTASKPNFDQLIDIVKNQQLMFNQVEKTLVTIGDAVNRLVSSVEMLVNKQETFETFMENANESLTESEKKLKLLTVTFDFQEPGRYKGKYYLLSNSIQGNFSRSQEKCEELGGYLAEIEDANENTFIKTFISIADYVSFYVLLGGTNGANASQWIWQHSQLPVSFTNWYPGQPDNLTSNHCLFMYIDYSWKWDNNPCNTHAYFLCEVVL